MLLSCVGKLHSSFGTLQGLSRTAESGSMETPLETVLRIEVTQYCELVDHISQSLNQLQLALIGTIEMSVTQHQLATDLLKKQV